MTLSTQFMTMLAMISMGILFGAALDTYNRFLQRERRKSWLVFINDVLFWTLQGLVIFFVLFRVNQGELRFYIFIALLCGFAAYQALFKQIYRKLLERIIRIVISIYRFIVKLLQLLIYRPIVALFSTIIAVIMMIGKSIITILKWFFIGIWSIIKFATKPIVWALLLIWKFFPKNTKKIVEKLYNKLAGYFIASRKYVYKWFSKWKKS